MLYVDTKTFLVGLNLNYNDKMSMANSVEVRVPFLDREFMQWAMSNIPPKFKLNGGMTKNILRNAMRSRLPAEVLRQPKAGFGAPVEFWLPDQLREMVDDLLGEENLRRRNLFDPEAVRTMIAEQRSGQGNWAYQIWQLLTLELWMQNYLDNRQAMPGKIA
jgi:asparagine synthase (glutamine-hydrolysing)